MYALLRIPPRQFLLEETLIPEALEDVLAYIEREFGITALGYLVDGEVEDGSALEPLCISESAA